jgi:hypothetical protein
MLRTVAALLPALAETLASPGERRRQALAARRDPSRVNWDVWLSVRRQGFPDAALRARITQLHQGGNEGPVYRHGHLGDPGAAVNATDNKDSVY